MEQEPFEVIFQNGLPGESERASEHIPLPHLSFRPCEEQRDVGAVLSGENGHGLLSVLNVEPINLTKKKKIALGLYLCR